jgi:hypothetical protein
MGLLGSILPGQQKVQFIQDNNTVIQLDASVHESHTRESPPTEFPVEDGSVISDHILVKPFSLEINGVISDTPINPFSPTQIAAVSAQALLPPVGIVAGAIGYQLFGSVSSSKSPSVSAYEQLLSLQQNGTPFNVLTTLKLYESMWIKSISVPRDVSLGNVLMFTIQLVQLILVSPQSISIQIYADPDTAAGLANVGQANLQQSSAFSQGVQAEVNDVQRVRTFFEGGG